MALLHKNLFASKWVQALSLAFGASFSADSSFAVLYVMYNPVCRRDILKKNRTANRLLAEALYPLQTAYSGQTNQLGFYIKSAWVFLKFIIKNRWLADCNPTLILAASQQPHAVIFKDVNRLLMLVQRNQRDPKATWTTAKKRVATAVRLAGGLKKSAVMTVRDHQKSCNENSVTTVPRNTARTVPWLQRIQNIFKRSNKVAPSSSGDPQRYDDAPNLFVDAFDMKRQFVADNIEEEARLSLLTLMMFPNADDFGSSSDSKRYLHHFLENLEVFRKSFGALFRLTKDLEVVNSSERQARLTRKERLIQRVSDLIFGEDMKLLRNFHSLTEEEAINLYKLHDFPDFEPEDFKVPSVAEILKQLSAADEAKPFQESVLSSQVQASKDGSLSPTIMKLEPANQAPQKSEPFQVTSTPVDESNVQTVAGVSAPRLGRSRPIMYSTKSLLVAAAKESASIGDPLASASKRYPSNELAIMNSEPKISRDDMISEPQSMQAAYDLLCKYQAKLQTLSNEFEQALQRERIANKKLIAESQRAEAESQRAEVAGAEVQALAAQVKHLHAALQVASLASSPSAQGQSSAAATMHNMHDNSSNLFRNESVDLDVAAAKLECAQLREEILMTQHASQVSMMVAEVKDLHMALKAVSATGRHLA
jgi:hypothetical protein